MEKINKAKEQNWRNSGNILSPEVFTCKTIVWLNPFNLANKYIYIYIYIYIKIWGLFTHSTLLKVFALGSLVFFI